MSSFQTAMGNIGAYFKQLTKGEKRNTSELQAPVAARKSSLLEVDRKKEIKRLKGLAGELQRAETKQISDIETNFYKDMITSFREKQNEAIAKYNEEATKFQMLSDEYVRNPANARWAAEVEAMRTPEGILDLFKMREEMAVAGYHSAGRFLLAHANKEDSPLWQAATAAMRMQSEKEFQDYFTGKISAAETSLSEATQAAIAKAEELAIPLETMRTQTLSDIQQAIKTRTQTPSNELLTETQQGPAKKPEKVFAKDRTRRIAEPNLFAERPQ